VDAADEEEADEEEADEPEADEGAADEPEADEPEVDEGAADEDQAEEPDEAADDEAECTTTGGGGISPVCRNSGRELCTTLWERRPTGWRRLATDSLASLGW
jgi:hypothetical protein